MSDKKDKHRLRFAALFPPTSRNMKDDYPELSKVKEFDVLTDNELKFVWYYSVLYKRQPEVKRLKLSCDNAFNKKQLGYAIDSTTLGNYIKGIFPEKITRAIEKMGTYDASSRFKARMFAEEVLATLENFAAFQEEDDEIDWDKRKKYTDTVMGIIEKIPTLISIVENGYGMRSIRMSKGEFVKPPLDSWHERKRG